MSSSDWNDAERRVERAQELFEQRKWQEALDELRAATNINPYNASWFFNIGLTLDELGRFDEAISAYEQALTIEPDDLQASHHLGLDLHQVGRFREAIEAFERVQSIDPSFEPSYCARIITHSELGEHDRAEEMFYLARLYKERCDECYYNVGVSLAARGLYDRAIYCFGQALDTQDDWPDVHFRIAKAYHAKGEFEHARRHYVLGLRQDPGSVDSLLDLSDLLIDMNRLDESGEKIRRAIELAPEEPIAHCCYGAWLARMERFNEARAALTKALELDPTCPTAHLHLGGIALRGGDVTQAQRHLRSELLLRPEDTETLHELGNMLIDAGELRAAIACLKRLVQLHPNHVPAWLNLGVAQFMRLRYEDGVASCEQALSLEPRCITGHFNLALALGQKGDFEEALERVRGGLRHAPRDEALQRLEFRLRMLRWQHRLISTFLKFIRR